MGSSSEVITVTCDCGREMRVKRTLAGDHTQCPACGATLLLPAAPEASVAPLCPHCGRPWPVDESRCPACLARTRTRRPRGDDEADDKGNVREVSKHFGAVATDPATPGPAYEPPPDLDPLTVRAARWYDKPTTVGWSIAATLTVAAGLVAMLEGIGLGAGSLISFGVALLLLAVALQRSSAAARSLVLAGPLIIVVIGSVLILWLAPASLSGLEAVVLTAIVGAMVLGMALLTMPHGTVAVVGLGAFLACFGLIATCIAASTTDFHKVLTGQVAAGLHRGVADIGQTLAAPRPAPEVVEEPPAEPPSSPPPPSPPPPTPPEPSPPPEPRPSPRLGPVDPTAVLTKAGFELTFPDVAEVTGVRERVEIDGVGPCTRVRLACLGETLETFAIIHEGVPYADPDQRELMTIARLVAKELGGRIQGEMWRRGRGPRTYYIRALREQRGVEWVARIETQWIGPNVVVFAAAYPKADGIAERQSWAFFRSLSHPSAEN